MALSNSVTGDGILVGLSTSVQTWITTAFEAGEGLVRYMNYETTTEETREWVALTEAAAKAAAEAAVQPTPLTPPDSEVASYDATEDQRTVQSYKLTKVTTKKINTRVEIE